MKTANEKRNREHLGTSAMPKCNADLEMFASASLPRPRTAPGLRRGATFTATVLVWVQASMAAAAFVAVLEWTLLYLAMR